jgi:Zn-dependent M28 family amino/carboxypeptidase
VRLLWLAAEEERALGSWIYARSLATAPGTAVVNLEAVGASDELVWIADDGWELRRFRTPPRFLAWADAAAVEARGAGLPAPPLLAGTLTDGRSFLARGIPAVTLSSLDAGEFPRGLHSSADSRDRLSPAAVERAVELLEAMVRRAERDPAALRAACSAEE